IDRMAAGNPAARGWVPCARGVRCAQWASAAASGHPGARAPPRLRVRHRHYQERWLLLLSRASVDFDRNLVNRSALAPRSPEAEPSESAHQGNGSRTNKTQLALKVTNYCAGIARRLDAA